MAFMVDLFSSTWNFSRIGHVVKLSEFLDIIQLVAYAIALVMRNFCC